MTKAELINHIKYGKYIKIVDCINDMTIRSYGSGFQVNGIDTLVDKKDVIELIETFEDKYILEKETHLYDIEVLHIKIDNANKYILRRKND